MKKLFIFFMAIFSLTIFSGGCSTPPEMSEAVALQEKLVENLQENHVAIEARMLDIYREQTDSDFKFIDDLLGPEGSAEAEKAYVEKVKKRDKVISEFKDLMTQNERNYKAWKQLTEALK